MSKYDHKLNVAKVRAQCGTPGHTNAVITCSCGLEETKNHSGLTDPDVLRAILYHRIAVIEKAIGMKFEVTFGNLPSDDRMETGKPGLESGD